MTVPADEYTPVTAVSSLAFVDIPIPWPYGNLLTNLVVIQIETSTGLIRNSNQGGFTFAKSPDGTSINVERYSVFSDEVSYRVERHLPIQQTYDLTEQGNLSSSALEQALDDNVRISQDNFENVIGNIVTSQDPYEVPGIVNRRGKVLGFDKTFGEPVLVGDIDEIDDLTQALADANQAAADATAAANEAEATAASIPQFNSASVDPTVNDDDSLNYQAGSLWTNTTTKNGFYCRDASTGAAIWSPVPNLSGYGADNFHDEYQGDLDLISPNSTYYIDPAFVSNFPTELGTDFGFIQTLQQSANYTVQVLYDMEVSKAWYRRKTSGSFSQWKKSMDLTDSEVVKNSFTKAFDPGVTNDDTEGYSQGSLWVNQNNGEAFICADASTGAAVWNQITPTASAPTVPTTQVFDTAGAFSYFKPAGLFYAKVTTLAGGGGGGGADNGEQDRVAGGGGAGATSIEIIAASALSASESLNIGAGGLAGQGGSSETPGGTGGSSNFGSFHSCTGGLGGGEGTKSSGGAGGTATGGDININGGGGGAGAPGRDVLAQAISGQGGSSSLGGGGRGLRNNTNQTGKPGEAYGSGGSGGLDNNQDGGVGKQGIIIVEEFYS